MSQTGLIAASLVVMKMMSASFATLDASSTIAMFGRRLDSHWRCSGRRDDAAMISPSG